MLPPSANPNEQEATHDELEVRFRPELFLQRRIWILDQLRQENVRRVLDVGCGEGQLLYALTHSAPWLKPPPPFVLSPNIETGDTQQPTSPNYLDDDIPDLHISELHGLDICEEDLAFAARGIVPKIENGIDSTPSWTVDLPRWEELTAKVWKGGLQSINEEFVDMECIVSTEVIEHLPESVFSVYDAMLLGVYHPRILLISTPSYTFNARFTAPDAPRSVRKGFQDPTGRTDRIFRHDDHQFEWTIDEFRSWCTRVAQEWGYNVHIGTVGRALEPDPFGRDEELQGASQVAVFRRIEAVENTDREKRGREKVQSLNSGTETHVLLASYQHAADPSAENPVSLELIANQVKQLMDARREAFSEIREMWFDGAEVAKMCGGWVEVLLKAVEESPDLSLARDIDGVARRRDRWRIELLSSTMSPVNLWAETYDGDTSADMVPEGWTPGEPLGDSPDYSDVDNSTGVEGDVSAVTSDDDVDIASDVDGWGTVDQQVPTVPWDTLGKNNWDDGKSWGHVPAAALSSTAGWDGDEDTTS